MLVILNIYRYYLCALIYLPVYAEDFSGSTDAIYATKIIYNDNRISLDDLFQGSATPD